jgi:hypothetical protein
VTGDPAKDRIARNEALFRQVNERVNEVSQAFAPVDPTPTEFVCECGTPDCVETVLLTLQEYEQVRSLPARFVLVPGHVVPSVEEVVSRTDRYVVVEKHPEERQIAEEYDPRRPL